MYDIEQIAFRPLAMSDISLMYRWLLNPMVSPWYGPPPDSETQIEEKYAPRIRGEEAVQSCIMTYQGAPVGYIQTYRIDSDSEYAAALDIDPDAWGIDLFIGDDAVRHRGFGPIALREFVKRIVFDGPRVSCCIIAPAVSNAVAIRAYEKAGFRHIKTVNVPGEDEPEYVMIMPREHALR